MEGLIVIAMMVIFSILGIGMGVQNYQDKQCRIEAIKAGVEPDKISQACGSK